MKLRPFPVSLNGNRLDPDQFGFHVDRSGEPIDIEFRCRGGAMKQTSRPILTCVVRIKRGLPDQAAGLHGWDGNREEPTVTPSIACDHRCGWHGVITKGEILP